MAAHGLHFVGVAAHWLHVCSQMAATIGCIVIHTGCMYAASLAAYMQPVGCTMQPLFWLLFLAFGCTWLRWSYRQLKMHPKSWLSAAGPAGRQRNIVLHFRNLMGRWRWGEGEGGVDFFTDPDP